MVKKVQAQMSTEVALDMLKASESIKAISNQVSSFTQSWKASEAQMKSAGDYLGAATAKYEGLGKTIEAQSSKIDKLKREQSELKGNTQETAQEYLKYQRQIDQATTRLSSLESQQNRAKQSMEYQKSGLAGLQHSFELNNKAIQSHIERLQAEGKSEEAQVTKVKGLDKALESLTSQYKKQRTETIAVAREFGQTSDEYLKAKTRLNETATAMAKTKSETNELRTSMEKQPNTYFLSMRNKVLQLKTAEEATAKQSRHLGDIIKGSFLGNALSNAFGMLTFNIGETVKAGYESAEAATQMGEKWKNIGASDKDVAQLGLSVKSLKENTNLSATAVGNLVTRFYSTTGSVKQANTLAKGVGSLSDQLKLSQSQSDAFANGLSKIESAGTVTSLSLGRLEKAAPGMSAALQKASGMSQKSFNDLVSSGKMTSDQFNQILAKASKDYGKNSSEFDKSSAGAMKHMQQTWADTRQALMKPLVKTSATGLTSLNKALNNKQTQAGVEKLGTGIAKLATKAASLINFLAKHQTAVATFGKVLIGAFAVKKLMGGVTTFSLGLSRMVIALKGYTTAAKTTAVTQKALNIAMKANIFIAVASAIIAIGVALVALYKHNKKFRDFVNGIAKDAKKYIGQAVDAVKNLGKWVGNIGSSAKKGWNNFTKSTSNGAKSAVKSFVSLKNDAGKHLSNLWNSGKSTFSNGWKTVTNASKSGARSVGNWFGNMSNDTRKKAIQMFNNHKATFQSGYKVLNNLTNTWHDFQTGKWGKLGSDLKNTVNSIRSFVHNIFADMYNKLNQMTGGRLGDMVKFWQDKMKAIGNTVSGAKEAIHKHFVDLVRGIIKPFNDMLSGLEKGINWVLDKVGAGKISGNWSVSMPSYAQGTQDTHQGGLAKVNDGQGANYREMYHLPNGQIGMFPAVKNMIVPLPKGTSVLNGDSSAQLAKAMGIPGYAGGIGDFFSGLWNGAKDVLDDTENILKKPAEFMESLFKHFMGGATSKVSLASDILTHFPITVAKDAIDWVKKQFQSIANPTGAGVARWEPIIKAVAASMNFNISGGQVSKLLKQIQTESGGNATVKQGISDINSASGHPAQGLLQFIPSTFAHWAMKGHTNILNGADQIMAAINALNHGGEGGWKNIGNGHGWENGGIVRNWQYAQIAEHNKPEAVIPLDSAKDSRAWQVLKAVVDAKTGGKSLDSNNATTTSNTDSKIAELTSTVNQMATMMKTIIGLNADQITAIKGVGTFDQKAQLKQEAKMLNSQSWTAI